MDASRFQGDLTLHAGITGEVVAKYFDHSVLLHGLNTVAKLNNYNNKLDSGADTLAHFKYDGGTGNDVLDIKINESIINDSIGDHNGASIDANDGNVFQMNINGGAGNDRIIVTMDTTTTTNHRASSITINGGTGNDYIDLNSANSTDYTFVVSFNGNFGTDTIVGFDVAAATDVLAQTAEVQELDFTDWAAHKTTAGTDIEKITIKIGNLAAVSFDVAGDLNDAGIATAVAAAINTMVDTNGDNYFNATVVGGTKVVFHTDSIAGYNGNKNYEAATVTLTKPIKEHFITADKIIHSTVANTLQEGGIVFVDDATGTVAGASIVGSGADVLDFSSYNVKGVSWYNTGAISGTDASFTDTTGTAFATADKYIYLIESNHHDGVYDVFTGTLDTVAANGSYDKTKGLQLLGTIDFGAEQAFTADNFIF